MAGLPEYVDCADRLDSFFGMCSGLNICVTQNTIYEDFVRSQFPETMITASPASRTYQNFVAGHCQVMANARNALDPQYVKDLGYEVTSDSYALGANYFTREPMSMATLDVDGEWSQLVDLTLDSLFAAEAGKHVDFPLGHGINITAAVNSLGSYGDLYEKHLQEHIPRMEKNLLQVNCSQMERGMMSSVPFGDLESVTADISSDSLLFKIQQRGILHCGVMGMRPGFATFESDEWVGFDVELCKAMAVAVLGDSEAFEIVEIRDEFNGVYFLDNDCDILLGMTAEALQERALEVRATAPYFYFSSDPSEASYVIATLSSEPELTDIVYWVLNALVFAEERSITARNHDLMPDILIYGSEHQNMFGDVIHAVGNYRELYRRYLEELYPRTSPASSCNRLNLSPGGPQQASFWI